MSTQRIIPFRFTDNAYCYTHITNYTIMHFLSAKQAFSFAQMVKIYIFYATRPHAMPLTSRLNAQFGIVGYLFFWCAEPDYTPSKILKSTITIAHSTPRAQIGLNLENQAY